MIETVMYTPTGTGGHARYTMEILHGLVRTGDVRPTLVTSCDLAPDFRSERYGTVATLAAPRHKDEYSSMFEWAWSRVTHYHRREQEFLRIALDELTAKIIHLQQYTPWLLASHAATMRRCGRKIVCTVHNVFPHAYPSGVPRRIHDHWRRSGWLACNGLIVHSDGLANELQHFLRERSVPIYVVPHGVWTLPDDTRERMSAPEPRRILHFGVLRRNKGTRVLLEALAHLPNVSLTIAGVPESAAFEAELKDAIASLPAGRVEFIAESIPQQQLEVLFARSALVVLPYTDFTAQSGVLFDALSFRRPVVVTDVGALGETVRDLGIGVVVAPSDVVGLATGIGGALQPTVYETLCGNVRAAVEMYSWDRVAEMTRDVYVALACEGKRRDS